MWVDPLTVGQHLAGEPPAYTERMATADVPLTSLPQAEASQSLARSWRRLTRAATAVAVVTSPAVYVWFTERSGMVWWKALLATVALVVVFRGFADLLFRRMIPWPSLFGVESRVLREEDVVGRRRAWFWRFWLKIGIWLFFIISIIWVFRGGSYFGTFGFVLDGIGNILSSPTVWMGPRWRRACTSPRGRSATTWRTSSAS